MVQSASTRRIITAFFLAGVAMSQGCKDRSREALAGVWVMDSYEIPAPADSSVADTVLRQYLFGWIKNNTGVKIELSLANDGTSVSHVEATVLNAKEEKATEGHWSVKGDKVVISATDKGEAKDSVELRQYGGKLIFDSPNGGKIVFGRK